MSAPGEYTALEFAREVLQRYDRGQWSSPLDMLSHMAAALRLLLEYIDQDNPPAAPRVPPAGGTT